MNNRPYIIATGLVLLLAKHLSALFLKAHDAIPRRGDGLARRIQRSLLRLLLRMLFEVL